LALVALTVASGLATLRVPGMPSAFRSPTTCRQGTPEGPGFSPARTLAQSRAGLKPGPSMYNRDCEL